MGQIHHKTPIKECGRPSPFNQGVPCGTDQTMEQADWKFKDQLMVIKTKNCINQFISHCISKCINLAVFQ